MSIKLKRAAVAAACAVGATVGALGMATPAYASTATADYSCTYPGGGDPILASTTWTYTGGELEISSSIVNPAGTDLVAGQVSTTINGSPVDNLFDITYPNPVILGPSPVTGPISAPNPLILNIDPPDIDVTCDLVTSSGFPLT